MISDESTRQSYTQIRNDSSWATPCRNWSPTARHVFFDTSANYTGHAMEKSFEAEMLICAAGTPGEIRIHLDGLIDLSFHLRSSFKVMFLRGVPTP